MHYTLVPAPDLALVAGALVAAWNADPHTQAVASATLARGASQQFSADYLQIALTIVEGLTLGVGGNALYDLIKTFLVTQGVRRRTQITELTQPDGTRLLVVTIDEE